MRPKDNSLRLETNSFYQRLLRTVAPTRYHHGQYLKYLRYHHRSFDVKGLTTQGIFTLDLEQIFVDLSLGPPSGYRMAADPVRPPVNAPGQRRHNLWRYLTDKRLKNRNFVILGLPGSGKSTLLKHATLALAGGKPPLESAGRFNKLPVLLFLRDHAAAIDENPELSLAQVVTAELARWDVGFLSDWLVDQLGCGRCLVLLDGLDEVGDLDLRQRVVAWVERQMARYEQDQFILASRPFGYRANPLPDVTVLEVRPFTIEQVQRFVHNWYLANELVSAQRDDPGLRLEATRGAEDLLWRLRQAPALLEMAVNPLLLTMITTVHRYRSNLPERRVELYAEIVEVFLGKWQRARGIAHDLTPAQKQRVLEVVAFYMMYHNKREIPVTEVVRAIKASLQRVVGAEAAARPGAVEEFLKSIENTSGLLMEREVGLYGFSHLTFQEFLAAVYVHDQKLENELIQRVKDSWWHETIRLYVAQADATHIVQACLASKKPSIVTLTLAMECLDEAREVRPELRTVFEKLAQSVDHKQPEVRRLAAEVLLTLRLRRLVRVDEGKYIDSSGITHAEYQIFLDDDLAHASYYLPDHWSQSQFPVEQGRTAVVGVRPSDALAFCAWLTARETRGQWRYRLPRAGELTAVIQQSRAQNGPRDQAGYWYQDGSAYKCTRFELADPAMIQIMHRQLEQRISYDWALEDHYHDQGKTLGRAGELVLTRARQRRFMLFNMNREPTLDFTGQPELAHDLSLACDRISASQAYHLESILSEAVKVAENLDLSQAHDVELEGAVQLVATFTQNLARAADLENAAEIARQIDRQFDHALSLAQKRHVVMNPELIRALSGARQHTREAMVLLDRAIVQARARVRCRLLGQIVDLLARIGKEGQNDQPQSVAQDKRQLAATIDWYLDFALLEERINQRLPAFEGIFIVRERK